MWEGSQATTMDAFVAKDALIAAAAAATPPSDPSVPYCDSIGSDKFSESGSSVSTQRWQMPDLFPEGKTASWKRADSSEGSRQASGWWSSDNAWQDNNTSWERTDWQQSGSQDAWRVGRHLLAGTAKFLGHFAKNVEASLARLLDGTLHDVLGDTGNLDVHLQGSDAIGFRHHAAGADLTGGDQFDARPGLVLMSTKVRRYLISIEKPMKPGQRG